MKLIVAYVGPDRLDALLNALSEHHVVGVTVAEARGFGIEHDPAHPEAGDYLSVRTWRRLRLELPCQDGEVATILAVFQAMARTGQGGAGRVFVLPLVEALDLRGGPRDGAGSALELGEDSP